MGRLTPTLLMRVEAFGDRMVEASERILRERKYQRLAEQMAACGTSVGANSYEADEAMSRADFAKTIGIVIKELNECRYWLRFCMRRDWVPTPDAAPIETEAAQLKSIFGAILSRTRKNNAVRTVH
jgi:four helix bundle protein